MELFVRRETAFQGLLIVWMRGSAVELEMLRANCCLERRN